MSSLLSGAHHKQTTFMVFVLLVFGAHLCFAEPPADPIDAGPVQQADLLLEFSSAPPAAIPCCEVSYSIRVVNQGPDSTDASLSLEFSGGILNSTTGCIDDLQGNGMCELGILSAGEFRTVSFDTATTACEGANLIFQGRLTGSVSDPIHANNDLAAHTTIGPDLPPDFKDLQPGNGTTFEFNPSQSIEFSATVVDREEGDGALDQSIEWRSDRVGTFDDVGSPVTMRMDHLGVGGHTITATVADKCDNTVSAETAIGIVPEIPIEASNSIELPTAGEQGQPDIASIGDDTFVVVWSELDPSDEDDDDGSIRAQRFKSNGEPDGDEILVNATDIGLQHRPAVAGLTDGTFTIVWESSPDSDPNNPLARVFLRQFNAQGDATAEQPVTPDADRGQHHPDVASRSDGSLLVAWESTSPDLNGDVVARFFDSSLNGLDAFPVNTLTSGFQGRPSVLFESDGGFLVAWQSEGSQGTDDDGLSIQARRFDELIQPLGAEVQVNHAIEGDQTNPSVASNIEGRLIAVWRGATEGSNGQKRTLRVSAGSPNGLGAWTQEVDVFGPVTLGPDDPTTQLFQPDVAMSQDGDSVVIWAVGPVGGPFSVQLRPVFGLGSSPVPFGSSFQLDENGLGLPTIAFSASSSNLDSMSFLAFWEREGEGTGSTPEGILEAMDIAGAEVTLSIPARTTELSLTATHIPNLVAQGRILNFDLEVENHGPAPAVDNVVQLTGLGEGGLGDWTFFPVPGCDEDPASPSVRCELGTLQVGERRELALSGRIDPNAFDPIDYTIEMSSATPLEPAPTAISGSIAVVKVTKVELFFDGFESGDTSAWSADVPFVGSLESHQIEDRP